jgi:SAM-dependent methyltransferase
MRLLVAIANHGTGSRKYIDQLLAAYRQMPIETSIVILSNVPKDLGPDVEVVVGVPSANPWSLPFAHRPIFRERLNQYDLFIYSEDDTLVTWENIKAFLEAVDTLPANEIAGFLRTERGTDGSVHYSTCHSFFRWIPGSVRQRSNKLWARYSNDHAACFIATRAQISATIERGGFPNEPHEGRFDMLCSAATDVYTRGGMERLVCIDELQRFSLPHLPNKYVGKMGLPADELEWQIAALRKIAAGTLPTTELLQPETKLPGCFASKSYREADDPVIQNLIGSTSAKIVVWGSGDGTLERALADRGHDVTVVPLDAIMGECCRTRGLKVIPPAKPEALAGNLQADVVLISNVLHLVDSPAAMLGSLRSLVRPGGRLIAKIPNLHELRLVRRRFKDPRYGMPWTREGIGAHPLTASNLRHLAASAGFRDPRVTGCPQGRQAMVNRYTLGLFATRLSSHLYLQAINPS